MVDKARLLDKYKVCQLHLSLIGHFPRVIYRDFLFTYPFFSISVYLLLFFLRSFIGVFVVAVPNAPPANVIGKNVTSTNIFVQWDEVPANNQNGVIVNYTVTYTELPIANGSSTAEVVIAPKRNATLTGLKKFTNYRVTVFASTAKGGGNRSDPIIVITDEDGKYNSGLH